jgi:flagella basal body P-ring formation protein FlgA
MGGPRSFRAEFNGLHTGTVTGAVYVDSGGHSTRVPVIANLTCPPPEVSSGQQLLAIAVVGHVKATAPAEARQPGRVGEIIRITNRATGASLRARVLDSRTVEIVP